MQNLKDRPAPVAARIKGVSQVRRLPRLGKIRLGELRTSERTGKQYPAELPYFRFDEESLAEYPKITGIYGEQPTSLDILFPVPDPTLFFPQNLKLYGKSRGLKCKGDGERAVRSVCAKCGELGCKCRDAGTVLVECECPCEYLDRGWCRRIASLMFMLYKITMGGVWQVDTGSYNSIVDINGGIDLVKGMTGRVAMVPLKLMRVKRQVHPEGQPVTTKHTLILKFDATMEEVLRIRSGDLEGYLLPAPQTTAEEEQQAVSELSGEQAANGTEMPKHDEPYDESAPAPPPPEGGPDDWVQPGDEPPAHPVCAECGKAEVNGDGELCAKCAKSKPQAARLRQGKPAATAQSDVPW